MQYIFEWIGATLATNVTAEAQENGEWYEDGVHYIIDATSEGYIDYDAIMSFEAENDDEAKKMGILFAQDEPNAEVFRVVRKKDDEVIFTEEDL